MTLSKELPMQGEELNRLFHEAVHQARLGNVIPMAELAEWCEQNGLLPHAKIYRGWVKSPPRRHFPTWGYRPGP